MVLKPNELQIGDVVCYFKDSGYPFSDMKVVRRADNGVYLRRAYIDANDTAQYEELYWHNDSNFLFQLLKRS